MMHSDIHLLQTALGWLEAEQTCYLVTVMQTAGSAPRPVGALMLMRADGAHTGSVSGGCVEQDLLARVQAGEWRVLTQPIVLNYGATPEDAERFQLPCGSELLLLLEPLLPSQKAVWWSLHDLLVSGNTIKRQLDLNTDEVFWKNSLEADGCQWDGQYFTRVWGSTWQVLLIGANDLALAAAKMAQLLDYKVWVCEPRVEYAEQWTLSNTTLMTQMPDDAVLALPPSMSRTCILALTHDPKLDDMALMEALKTKAFYIGALGSKVASERRRERLLQLDLSLMQVAKLHAPIGLPLGSRTPAEIAVAIFAHITQLRRALV